MTGQRWPDALADQVLEPVGMTRTFSESTVDPIPDRARGYVENDRLADAEVWTAEIASGGLLSSALDLAKWDLALRSETLLTEAAQRETWEPVLLNSGVPFPTGLGWELRSSVQPDRRSVGHSGELPGFRAEHLRFIDDDVTIIVLMNLDDVDWWTIVNGLASIHLP